MSLKIADDLPTTYEDRNRSYENGDFTLRTIEWSVLEAPPKTIHYYSNLPCGWIPQNDLEFVQLFMNTWKEDWLSFCREGRRYLGRLVSPAPLDLKLSYFRLSILTYIPALPPTNRPRKRQSPYRHHCREHAEMDTDPRNPRRPAYSSQTLCHGVSEI